MKALDAEIKVGVCQMNSRDSVEFNKKQISYFLKNFETPQSHVDLVSFPENSLYFRIKPGDVNRGLTDDDAYFKELGAWAKQHESVIHLGSVALKGEGAKLSNVSVWIDRTGKLTIPYKKIHLFDVDVDGEKPVRESDYFLPGDKPSIVEIDQWRFGLSICYDLRFSELFLYYAKAQVDVVLIPSAFLVKTGQAHWHTLMRARAIEMQAYVVAAAQGGEHLSESGDKRNTFGHSIIVGPWGDVLAEVNDSGENFITQTLTKKSIKKVREQIPMRHHLQI